MDLIHESKAKFLDAALHVIRSRGYSATRVEDVCEAAGLTKGSFFHHFDSKEELALAAAAHFAAMADRVFASAPYQELVDPLERLVHLDPAEEVEVIHRIADPLTGLGEGDAESCLVVAPERAVHRHHAIANQCAPTGALALGEREGVVAVGLAFDASPLPGFGVGRNDRRRRAFFRWSNLATTKLRMFTAVRLANVSSFGW